MAANIDFILVAEKKKLVYEKLDCLSEFLKSLQSSGLICEVVNGKNPDNVYISVYVPDKPLAHFASVYDIDISNEGHAFLPYIYKNPYIYQTPISDLNYSFQRNGSTAGATKNERSLLTLEILKDAKFGKSVYGIDHLKNMGVIKKAFPMHDGDFEFDPTTELYYLNDRQLLAKYWATFSFWYKEQPLNLIQKYYGNEIAFYFAWLGFYIKMLVPAAIIGSICFSIGLLDMYYGNHYRIDEVCDSNLTMCAICHTHERCIFQKIKTYCIGAKISFLCDNPWTLCFSIFMSLWATFFMNRWKAYENILKLRWNATKEDFDTRILPYHKEKTRRVRFSHISGKMEPYNPQCITLFHLTLTYGVCLLLVVIVLAIVFGVIIYRITMSSLTRMQDMTSYQTNFVFLTLASSAIIQGIFLKLFSFLYRPISVWLTSLENPRTQSDFDKSVILKRFVMAFANNYGSLFYIAFLKGQFYMPNHKPSIISLETDICGPSGCVMPLAVQVGFLIIIQSLVGNLLTLLKPLFIKLFRFVFRIKKNEIDLENFENEYYLEAADQYIVTKEFMEMIIQYGFVTFFVAAFPLAPLCALVNNVIELRIDAIKFVKRRQRFLSRPKNGIGIWNNLLRALTYTSIATNAFVIAFTTDFVTRQEYLMTHSSLKGYVLFTLSEFHMDDHILENEINPMRNTSVDLEICHYSDFRYPPGHMKEYKLTTVFWYTIMIRLIGVIVFEHVLICLNALLSWILPDVPDQVKEYLNFKMNADRNLKLKSDVVKEITFSKKPIKL